MSDDSAFIQAILSNADVHLRLIYADWLEERGDPRAELIRLDLELNRLLSACHTATNRERYDNLKSRFDELRPSASLVWQALLIEHSLEPRSLQQAGPKETGPALCPNRICGWGNPVSLRHCASCQYPLPLAAGSVVAGRYRIERQLALGSFGYCYRGVALDTGRSIILKELTTAESQDFSYLVPFFREEGDLLSSLQANPMVVRLLEYLEQDRAAYLVLEHLGDGSMAASLGGVFPFDWVVNVGKQLCDLLDLMHRQDPPLLWGDLRLDHLYLAEDRQTVKVLPEVRGTARWVKYSLGRLRERLEGVGVRLVCGLGMDQPAERVIGMPEPRSDLFSLASVLYALLTGRAAEGTFTRGEILRGLAAIPEDERWLHELIAINLCEEVGDRYYSARAIQTDLARRAVSRRVACLHCGQVNPVRQPHCRRCSRPLTDWAPRACRRCGKRYRMGMRSCASCGSRVWG
jgi:uncharacterized protein (TIGR02996 family)